MKRYRRARRSGMRKIHRAVFEGLEQRTLLAASVLKIMPLGDSITEAFTGHASYRYWLWNQLASAGYTADFVGSEQPPGVSGGAPLYPDFDPDHEGHVGWTAEQIYSMTQDPNWINYTEEPQNTPDIVLLHIGTNDLEKNPTDPNAPANTIIAIGQIIDGLRGVNANVKILLAQVIPDADVLTQVQTLNSLMPALVASETTAQSPVTLIDQYTGFDVNTDTYDGIHPSESGEKKIAQIWYNALTPLLPTPTPPPAGDYVDHMPLTLESNGWGPVEFEMSNGESGQYDGQMITLNGVNYMHGLGVNSPSDVAVDITGTNYTDFLADIGIDDEVGDGGSVQFHVLIDGQLEYDSGLMTGAAATKSIDVQIPANSHTLELIVTDGGDDQSFDHADWANARLIPAVQTVLPPAVPALSGQLNGQEIDLSWTDSSNDVEGYRIERKDGVNGTYSQIADLTDATFAVSYNDTNVQNGHTYYYHVDAYNSGGTSDFSNEVNVVVPALPPPAIPVLSAIQSGTQVNLSWTDTSNDVNEFHIERKIGVNGTYSPLVDLVGATFAFNFADTTVQAGNTYFYHVNATSPGGTSDFSTEQSVAVTIPAPAIPVLSGQLVGQQINLSWTESSQTVTGYRLEKKVGANGVYQQIADLTGPKTFADFDIVAGNTYYYHVDAYNGGGTSNFSNEINIPVSSQSTVYLSDQNYTVIANGYGPAEKDKSNGEQAAGDGHTLTLNGQTFAKGLGVHAASEVDYNLNNSYSQFLASVGVDDEVGNNGSVDFQVFLDNSSTPIFDSGKMTGASAAQTVNVSLTGASLLRLVVTTAGDGNNSDHADWANAQLVTGTPVVLPATPSNLAAAFNSGTGKIDLTWVDAANDATGYKIERKIGVNGTYSPLVTLLAANLNTLGYSDAGVSQGNTYYYHVFAYNGNGNSGISNETFATDPIPPGTVYLSDQNYTVVSNGYGPAEKDTSNGEQPAGDGHTLTLNNVTFAKGLGVHAASEIDFNLNNLYSQFLASVGVDDEVGNNGSVDFQVFLDNSGTPIFDSGKMTGSSATQVVNVNVTGKSLLRLVVTTAGDGNNSDHADWANAQLVAGAPISPPTAPTTLAASFNANTNRVDLSWADAANDATGFRIERKLGAGGAYQQIADLTGATYALSYSDANVSPGVTYVYHVYAYNSGGNSGFTNEQTVQIPIVAGTVYLSDLPLTVNSNGYGPAERDTSNGEAGAGDGHTITLNGVTYAKGMGVHANSQITVALNKQYTQFLSNIGVDDEVGSAGSVDFQVWLDNVKVFDSGTMTGSSATQTVNIDVTNKTTMQLIVTDNGDGNTKDHSDWANARLVAGQPILPPAAPTNFNAVLNGSQVDLSWAAGSNDQTGFRVQRKTGSNGAWTDMQTLSASTFSWSDLGPLAPSTAYDYRVIAFNGVGDSQPSSDMSITTPAPNIQVYVSDLTPTSATNGWGPVEVDRSNGEQAAGDGHFISIRGNTYLKGLGVHGLSQVVYNLGGQYTTFTSDIGVDDETGGKGSVDFQVLVDGVLKYDSGTVLGTDPVKQVSVNVTGAQTLTLIVTNANDGASYDHADWANAQLFG